MATLTTALTITSTDASTDVLQLSVTDSLNVGAPMNGPSRVSVPQSGGTAILTTGQAVRTHIYVKNMDSADNLIMKTAGGAILGILAPLEWTFFTLYPDQGLTLFSEETGPCDAEYAYWSKA